MEENVVVSIVTSDGVVTEHILPQEDEEVNKLLTSMASALKGTAPTLLMPNPQVVYNARHIIRLSVGEEAPPEMAKEFRDQLGFKLP